MTEASVNYDVQRKIIDPNHLQYKISPKCVSELISLLLGCLC